MSQLNIRYETIQSPRLKVEGLFKHDGVMKYWLKTPSTILIVCNAYISDILIATGVILKNRDVSCNADIGVYVKQEYRNLGIGSSIVKRMSYYKNIVKPGGEYYNWYVRYISCSIY